MATAMKRKAVIEAAAAAPAQALANGAEAWIEAQETFLAEIDQCTRSWVRRRREAIEEARRMLDEVNRNPDPGSVFLAQQHWLSGSIQRVVSDFGDLGVLALKCMSRTGDRMFEATQRTRGMAEDLATAGAKPGEGETEQAAQS
ncbi:MAG TPA: hypothetical protein VLV50_03595 [Stellaceae bacterium]|nr:hypothetical protein [Stellaceae bacterium]